LEGVWGNLLLKSSTPDMAPPPPWKRRC